MNAAVADVINGALAGSVQASQQRTSLIGENLTQGLGVVQTLSVQTGNGAISSQIGMSDDAQAAMGLRTAIHVPTREA